MAIRTTTFDTRRKIMKLHHHYYKAITHESVLFIVRLLTTMEVKKLMENLVLCGLSLDISSLNARAKSLHINKNTDIETKSIIFE